MSQGRVLVVGLGPAGPGLVTSETLAAIEATPHRYLRTSRHPAASVVGEAVTFDDLYDSAASLDEVYPAIVERLRQGAIEHGEVLYAVSGSPAVAERSVELVLADPAIDASVLPALSFADLAWARLGVDPVAEGARLVDGQRFGVEAAGERGPLLVAQCDRRQVLSEVKLAVEGEAPASVTVLQRLGLLDESVFEVAWADLDRAFEPDHLTSLWIPFLAAPVARELQRFAELVVTLRRECPWDREQTHLTLTRHLLEETYETLEAIEGVDPDAGEGYEHLEEELGDLLFQVFFHATLAAEEGQFTVADVARGIHDKLYSRHPHVFGDVDADSAGQVMRNWEQIKKAEKGRASVMDGIPRALPALLYALKVQKKGANSGFPTDGPAAPHGDIDAAGVGELLFSVVVAAERASIDPEAALRAAADRYRSDFELWERKGR